MPNENDRNSLLKEYGDQIQELCRTASAQNMKLRPEQVRDAFADMKPGNREMLEILRHLNERGIRLEMVIKPEGSDGRPEPCSSPETPVPLSAQEQEYLERYLSELKTQDEVDRKAILPYLIMAAEMAAEMHSDVIPLPDLIQEANIALLLALEEKNIEKTEESRIAGKIRMGIEEAIQRQAALKQTDNILVEKVSKLEKAVREANGEGGEMFSIAELAVLLDMDPEEIKAILRLTGDE